jgi:hypothetical protein
MSIFTQDIMEERKSRLSLVVANVSSLLVLDVLAESHQIRACTTKIAGQHVAIGMRQEIHKFVDLGRHAGIRIPVLSSSSTPTPAYTPTQTS